MESKINHEANELNYYFGGYFEAKGRIYLIKNRKSKGYGLSSAVFFSDKKVAELFKQNFGGLIIQKDTNFKFGNVTKKKYKLWLWKCNAESTTDFLQAIQPYIIGKKLIKKIELMIKFRRFRQRNFCSNSKYARETREKYYQEMKKLNR